MAHSFLGIEIGGTKLQLVSGDDQAHILERRRLTVEVGKGAEGIRHAIQTLLQEWKLNPAAVGVGFGGPVNWQTGVIARSHQVSGWSDFPLREWLESIMACPVRVENDANVGALGEAVFGAGTGFDSVFYVTLGSGVGGGMVQHKKIYHGAFPGEAEIGHLRINAQGAIVESVCSGWAVNRAVLEKARKNPSSPLALQARSFLGEEAKAIVPALRAGDASASSLLDEVAAVLALALSHITHLFHPQIIILGGGLSLMGAVLIERLEQQLNPLLMEIFLPGPKIVTAALQEEAVPRGALQLAVDWKKS